MFKPLKVTFNLVSPTIPPDGGLFHLDGLLAYAVVQDALLKLKAPVAQNTDFKALQAGLSDVLDTDANDFEVSGDKANAVESVFKASCIQFEGIDPVSNGSQVMMTRRTEVEGIAAAKDAFDKYGKDIGKEEFFHPAPMLADQRKSGEFVSLRMDKIETGKGPLRNHQFFLPTIFARRAVAYCIGNAESIQRLCDTHIKSVGRKGTAGYGMVGSVFVEVDDSAIKNWKVRSFPWPVEGYVPVEGNSSPPYWETARKKKVWIPATL